MFVVTIGGTATSNIMWAFAIVYSVLVIVETRLGLGLPDRLPLGVVTDHLALVLVRYKTVCDNKPLLIHIARICQLALLSAYGYRL